MKCFLRIYLIFFSLVVLATIGCKDQNEFKQELPHINIVKDLPFSKKEKEKCGIEYRINDTISNLTGAIKHRGGMSIGYDKKSFSLELDKKFPLANLPIEDDWILNASYVDKTFMRHKISYDLFRQMDERNVSAQSQYITVSINNEPQGIYILTEEITGKKVGLDKKNEGAVLYKDPPLLYEDKIKPQEESNYYQQKWPKKKKVDKTLDIEELRSFLFESSNTEFDAEISSWVDIRTIVDWHLLLLFSNNGDGIMKNFYLFRRSKNLPFQIAIWDYDHSFGRDGDNELNMMDRPAKFHRSILFNRLKDSKHIGYSKMLSDRYRELRSSGVFSYENIDKMLLLNTNQIKDKLNENTALWPNKSKWYFDENGFDDEMQIIRNFVKLRLGQMDEEMKAKVLPSRGTEARY